MPIEYEGGDSGQFRSLPHGPISRLELRFGKMSGTSRRKRRVCDLIPKLRSTRRRKQRHSERVMRRADRGRVCVYQTYISIWVSEAFLGQIMVTAM
jgi:hypothetical protein